MARNLGTAPQDVNEAVTHTVNWNRDLNGGEISTVTWTAPGLTVESATNTTSTSCVRLSGGTAGQTHIVNCAIETSLGENKEVEFTLEIND
jgi:hypothetical protein